MCTHRAISRWHRFWDRFSAAFLVGFLVPEVYGLVTVGPDATWSAWWWHRLGVTVPCRHSSAGRAAIVLVGLWLIAHLGWGRLGFGAGIHRCRSTSGTHPGGKHVRQQA